MQEDFTVTSYNSVNRNTAQITYKVNN